MFSMTIRPEVLASLREQYPAGCTVVLEQMSDPYREMPAGMTLRHSTALTASAESTKHTTPERCPEMGSALSCWKGVSLERLVYLEWHT